MSMGIFSRARGIYTGCLGIGLVPVILMFVILVLIIGGVVMLRSSSSGSRESAVADYERALRSHKPPADTKVIWVDWPVLLQYRIAYHYLRLAEEEGDASLYVKAEEAIRESYEAAIVRHYQGKILCLWGCILFRQERYEEALAKFGQANELLHGESFALLGIGTSQRKLGNREAAHQAFEEFLERFSGDLYGFSSKVERWLQE